MYIPEQYREDNREEILALIRNFPFALVTGVQNSVPIASHIPMELTEKEDGTLILTGHISIANDLKTCINEGQTLLVVFQAEHAYISPSWYNHPNVPTWNYRAVHCYGKPGILTGEALRQAMSHLTRQYEGHRPNGRLMESLTERYIESHLRGIIGFQLVVSKVEAVAKLSQNRDAHNYQSVIENLAKEGGTHAAEVAKAMRKRGPKAH